MARNPWKKLVSNIELSILARSAHRDTGFRRAGNANAEASQLLDNIITWQELSNQFNDQQGKCYWFGIPLNPDDIFNPIARYPLAISADRLDNEGLYVPGNVVITCRLANFGRGQCTAEEFSQVMNKIRNPKTNKWIIYTD